MSRHGRRTLRARVAVGLLGGVERGDRIGQLTDVEVNK